MAGIRSGIADIGWCVQGYWPEQTPLSDVISLPFLPIKIGRAGERGALEALREISRRSRRSSPTIEPLLLYTTSPNFLITTKKQVKTLEDLKGMKIRMLGGPPTEMAKALGAVPAPMPMPDMYQALDKGVFDGAARAVGGDPGLPALRGRQERHHGAVLRRRTSRSAPTGRRCRACRRTCATRS